MNIYSKTLKKVLSLKSTISNNLNNNLVKVCNTFFKTKLMYKYMNCFDMKFMLVFVIENYSFSTLVFLIYYYVQKYI